MSPFLLWHFMGVLVCVHMWCVWMCICMFTCMWVHMLCGHSCFCVCVHVEALSWHWVSFLVTLHFAYEGRVSHWTQSFPVPASQALILFQESPSYALWVRGLWAATCRGMFRIRAPSSSPLSSKCCGLLNHLPDPSYGFSLYGVT